MLAALPLGDAREVVATGGTAATAVLPAITTATWAIPLVGAGVAAALIAITLISRRGKRRQAATEIVNELEPILRQNLDGFMSGPRTRQSQAAALQVFDEAWSYLTSGKACGSSDLGGAGEACISDRQRGGTWDWFGYYRDPIERAELAASSNPFESLTASTGLDIGVLAGAGLILAALFLGGIK